MTRLKFRTLLSLVTTHPNMTLTHSYLLLYDFFFLKSHWNITFRGGHQTELSGLKSIVAPGLNRRWTNNVHFHLIFTSIWLYWIQMGYNFIMGFSLFHSKGWKKNLKEIQKYPLDFSSAFLHALLSHQNMS